MHDQHQGVGPQGGQPALDAAGNGWIQRLAGQVEQGWAGPGLAGQQIHRLASQARI